MKIFKVGGAVRDELLGLKPKDNDWLVVGSSIEEMLSLGYKQVGKDFPVFLHPETNEEYALARKELKSGHGYKNFDFIFTPDITIEEDLERRDLTINAIARSSNGEIIDPFNGQADIKNKIFRHVSEAFYEDPLRALRVARFKSQMPEFQIHDSTQDVLRKIAQSGELSHLSNDRVWGEVQKSLNNKFEEFLYVIRSFQLTEPWFEELVEIPEIESDMPEIKWCYVSDVNDFKFAKQLEVPNSFSRQLLMWKRFHGYKLEGNIEYKLGFFSAFSKNNLEESIFTLKYFKEIQIECIPIIKEYANYNFGELLLDKNKDAQSVKMEVLKEIIKKYEK